MRAFVLDKYGAPLRKASVPEPVAGPHQVLVRVAAAGVCHADERMRTGKFKAILPHDLPAAMGGELSGEVVAVGDRVGGFAVGDEVYAYTGARTRGPSPRWPLLMPTPWPSSPARSPPRRPPRCPWTCTGASHSAARYILPDAGHGGVFQHHEEFIPALLRHLDA